MCYQILCHCLNEKLQYETWEGYVYSLQDTIILNRILTIPLTHPPLGEFSKKQQCITFRENGFTRLIMRKTRQAHQDADSTNLPRLTKNSILDVWQGLEYISTFGTTQSFQYDFYKKQKLIVFLFLLKTCICFNLHCFFFSNNRYGKFNFLASQRFTNPPMSVHMTLRVRRINMWMNPKREKSLGQKVKTDYFLSIFGPTSHLILLPHISYDLNFTSKGKKFKMILEVCYGIFFYCIEYINLKCSNFLATQCTQFEKIEGLLTFPTATAF